MEYMAKVASIFLADLADDANLALYLLQGGVRLSFRDAMGSVRARAFTG